jgi:hypothetical protein
MAKRCILEPIALHINEFGLVTGLGRTTIYGLISDDKLLKIEVAGRSLIPMSEADRLIGEAIIELLKTNDLYSRQAEFYFRSRRRQLCESCELRASSSEIATSHGVRRQSMR